MPTTKEILESIRAQKVTPEVKESETISPETKTILGSIRAQKVTPRPEEKPIEVKPIKPPEPIWKETLKDLPEAAIETIKKIPTKIAWGTILTIPKIRDKYIEKNPQAVIDFIDDYEKIVGPFVRTIYPTRIPLAISEKITGKKLASTYEEMAQKHPFVTAISGLFGDIYNLVSVYKLTGGIEIGRAHV